MIRSNKELYQEINLIIKMLKDSGNVLSAIKLDEALSTSTVTSEVLYETRLTLENLNSKGIPASLAMKDKVDEALQYLNKVL